MDDAKVAKLNGARKPADIEALHARLFRHAPATATPRIVTGCDLATLKDDDTGDFVMDDLFAAASVTVLAGAPKVGKSWFCLQAAIAKATGGKLWEGRDAEVPGRVLYLALEDTTSRLKRRIEMLHGQFADLGGLAFCCQWPRAGQGGRRALLRWLAGAESDGESPILLIVDTLQKWRAIPRSATYNYHEDYAALTELQRLAIEFEFAVVVVTHTRKQKSEDFVEEISGTHGISGAADTLLSLTRQRGTREAKLSITGRDVEESELWLSQDAATMRWSASLSGPEVGDTRRHIMNVLPHADGPAKGMKPQDIAQQTGINGNTVRQQLRKMRLARQVEFANGRYFRHAETG